jgi:hypothetical protein
LVITQKLLIISEIWQGRNEEFYRGPYIDAFCQAWFHFAQLFQRNRIKYEKVNGRTTDDGRQVMAIPGQMEPHLSGTMYARSYIKLLHLVPFGQYTLPLLLKRERMVKLHVFGNNSKTVSYSFWNKGWTVLKFWKFDEKRAITPR